MLFDVDLYGTKKRSLLTQPLLLTSRQIAGQPELSFHLERKPFEANFCIAREPKEGLCFSLIDPQLTRDATTIDFSNLETVQYFFNVVPVGRIVRNAPRYYLQKKKARRRS